MGIGQGGTDEIRMLLARFVIIAGGIQIFGANAADELASKERDYKKVILSGKSMLDAFEEK
jgi:hypothetical protein